MANVQPTLAALRDPTRRHLLELLRHGERNVRQLTDASSVSQSAVIASLARLSPEQRNTEVPCYLVHDGNVMADRAMPWASVAIDVQANVHVPAHTGQLGDLIPTTAG